MKTSALETAYEKALKRTHITIEEEKARQLRIQILLTEDENESLQEELAQEDKRIDELENVTNKLQEDLDESNRDLRVAQSDLRGKARDMENMRVLVHYTRWVHGLIHQLGGADSTQWRIN